MTGNHTLRRAHDSHFLPPFRGMISPCCEGIEVAGGQLT